MFHWHSQTAWGSRIPVDTDHDLKKAVSLPEKLVFFDQKKTTHSISSNFFVIESYELRFEQLFGLCLKSSNPRTFCEIPFLRGSNFGYSMASETAGFTFQQITGNFLSS